MTRFLAFLFLIFLLTPSCYLAKSLIYTFPDEKDPYRFEQGKIEKGDSTFSFHKSEEDWSNYLKANDWTSGTPVYKPITQILNERANNAFLVIRRDTILFEHYSEGHEASSIHTSWSMAKSVTSALIGFAIQDGFIESEDELVVKYIPELSSFKESEQLTLRHLLNHTSGIKNGLVMDGVIYYGNNCYKGIPKIKFDYPPGVHQQYVNMNSMLLGMVLKNATKLNPATYLQEKIWQPLGMESDAFWSVDKKNNLEKTYCCLNATARDYAKFGRLFLNMGAWEGKQILDKSWVEKSLGRDDSEGSSHGYGFSWHIGLKEYGDYSAQGLYWQYIYVYPEKEIIIVSLNDRENKNKSWRTNYLYIMRQLADLL